jgi:myo-inositol-1(or 4)-monophosphatase
VKSAPGDVVSLADEQSERAILDVLDQQRPDDGVLAEEGGRRPGTRTWLVDAVDGTLNFVSQDPFWCTAVTLEHAHGALVAAVHHPATDETFSAARARAAGSTTPRYGCPTGRACRPRSSPPTSTPATSPARPCSA